MKLDTGVLKTGDVLSGYKLPRKNAVPCSKSTSEHNVLFALLHVIGFSKEIWEMYANVWSDKLNETYYYTNKTYEWMSGWY